MAYYQNTGTVTTSGSIVMGGFKLEYAATAAASYTNLGIGRNLVITENLTMWNAQADNGPDPIRGVSRHTATIAFELLEWYLPSWDKARGTGFDLDTAPSVGTYITGGSVQSLSTGGNTALTRSAFKFSNAKLVSGATVETAIVFYKAYLNAGMTLTLKSDNDEDPINVAPFTLEAECDTDRSAGDQLMVIETEVAE